jgi:hypothetical protein
MIRDRITKVRDWHRDYAAPNRFARPEHFMTLELSMICTLVLENGRRDSLLYFARDHRVRAIASC